MNDYYQVCYCDYLVHWRLEAVVAMATACNSVGGTFDNEFKTCNNIPAVCPAGSRQRMCNNDNNDN